MADARIAFLPWLRQGAATAIQTIDDGSATLDGSAALDVAVDVNNTHAAAVTLRLHGPGDVIGLDSAQILRTVPVDLNDEFEPNLFPAIEFRRPDLPWLFSPANAGTTDRLRPWLVLIVVERRVGVSIGTRSGAPLPVLEIATEASAELPPLGESWAWAHTQIAGTLVGADLDHVVRSEQQRTTSRLLCPRALAADSAYMACLVPAFEAGVQAGLGQPVTTTDLTPAWAGGEGTVALPIYYHWRFSTGHTGNFEALVKALDPRPLPVAVGKRDLDVSHAGFGLPDEVNPVIIGLEGALRAPGARPSAWPPRPRASFETALTTLLDAPEKHAETTPAEKLIGPPLYGRWHAAQRTVPEVRASPLWLRDLNLDPRNRVAAGTGTLVVQARQEELMAAAWAQVGEILRANQLLRCAQLARAGAGSIYVRHVAPLTDGTLLLFAGPALSRLKVAANTTARGALAGACVTPAMVSGAFRKVMRPRGPISRRFRRTADRPLMLGQVVRDVGQGKHTPPSRRLPGGTQAMEDEMLARLLASAVGGREPGGVGVGWPAGLAEHVAHLAALEAGSRPGSCAQLDTGGLAGAVVAALDPEVTIAARALAQLDLPADLWQPNDPIDPIMVAPEFPTPMYLGLKELSQEWLMPGLKELPANTLTIAETNAPFVESYMVGLNHEMGRELLWRDYPTDQRGSYFRQFWDPRGRVPVPSTDAAREAAKDIGPIHAWNRRATLGTHLAGGAGSGQVVLLIRGDLLRRYPRATVCLQRAVWSMGGAGSPVAARVLADPTGSDAIRYPIFSAALEPDICVLGFAIDPVTIRGTTDPAADDPGWFVVFQEQPTEPAFGIGAAGTATSTATTWSGIDWNQIVLTTSGHVDLQATAAGPAAPAFAAIGAATGNAWGEQSAAMAAITLKHPFRFAVHADDMVP